MFITYIEWMIGQFFTCLNKPIDLKHSFCIYQTSLLNYAFIHRVGQPSINPNIIIAIKRVNLRCLVNKSHFAHDYRIIHFQSVLRVHRVHVPFDEIFLGFVNHIPHLFGVPILFDIFEILLNKEDIIFIFSILLDEFLQLRIAKDNHIIFDLKNVFEEFQIVLKWPFEYDHISTRNIPQSSYQCSSQILVAPRCSYGCYYHQYQQLYHIYILLNKVKPSIQIQNCISLNNQITVLIIIYDSVLIQVLIVPPQEQAQVCCSIDT